MNGLLAPRPRLANEGSIYPLRRDATYSSEGSLCGISGSLFGELRRR
jgi:hypothetical protein